MRVAAVCRLDADPLRVVVLALAILVLVAIDMRRTRRSHVDHATPHMGRGRERSHSERRLHRPTVHPSRALIEATDIEEYVELVRRNRSSSYGPECSPPTG